MLVDLKRMIAYICPFCSNISTKIMSIFNFSGAEKLNMICPTHGCHETCASIISKNTKYNINVECPLCGGTHSYSISRETFWNRPLITYKCPAAGIDIFFAGERDKVEQALEEYSDIYSDVIDDLDEKNINDTFNVLYAILERLNNLMDKNSVTCVCGNDNIDIRIQNGNIIMRCEECNAEKLIEPTTEALIRILNTNAIVIDK